MLSVYASGFAICLLAYYLARHSRTKAEHRRIIQREGCEPLRCLPNKWFLPFGLDKLRNVLQAEATKTYPMLMLRDHEKYGDRYALFGGPVYTVITRHTSNIRELLSGQFEAFEVGSGRHGCVRPLLGNGIFTQDGPAWEASRKLLAPMIQRPTLPDLDLFEQTFQQLQGTMSRETQSNTLSGGSAINLTNRLLDLNLKMITEFLLGANASLVTPASNAAKWSSDFAGELEVVFKWISRRERYKIFYWMIDGIEFRTSCSVAKRLVDEMVCRAMELQKLDILRSESSETHIAFEPLLRTERDPEIIRDQFMNLVLAGRDSSGSLLCWIFYALARQPQSVAKLMQEVESVLGSDKSRTPSKAELSAMTKLDSFICETLRLFPPIPLNGRISTKDTFLPRGGGEMGDAPILIPKGTLVAFSTFAVQRSQELYGQDASKFRDERWENDAVKQRRMVDYSYHPFLAGPRKCLGERFAITQAKYLTCRVLQHYEYIVPTDEAGNSLAFSPDGSWVDDVKYHVGLTTMPDAGVWLRFVPKF